MHSSVAGQPVPEEMHIVNLASGLAFAAMAVGISAAWVLYRNKSEDLLEKKIPARLYQLAFDKWRVDELYGADHRQPDSQARDRRRPRRHDLRRRADDSLAELQDPRERQGARPHAERRRAHVRRGHGGRLRWRHGLVLDAAFAHRRRVRGHPRRALRAGRARLRVPLGRELRRRARDRVVARVGHDLRVRPTATFAASRSSCTNSRSGVDEANSRHGEVGPSFPSSRWSQPSSSRLTTSASRFESTAATSCSASLSRKRAPRVAKRCACPWVGKAALGVARVIARPLVEATVEVRNAFGNTSARPPKKSPFLS